MADESQPIVPRCPSPVLSVLSQFAERSGPAVTVETIGEQPSYDEVSSQFNIPSSPPKSPSLCSQSPTNLPSPAYDLTDTLPAKSPSPFHESPSIPIHFDTDEVVTRDVETPPRPTQSRPMERTPPDTPVSGVSTSTNVKSSGEETEETAWICPACSVAYADGVDMIACDNCDVWYHFACVGITQAPPADEKWYCGQCRKLANSNRGAFAKKKSTGPNMVGYGGKRKKAGGKK